MGHFRIELVEVDGMIAAVAFAPDGTKLVSSDAIFHDRGEAEVEVADALRRAWPDRAPRAVDPTLGV